MRFRPEGERAVVNSALHELLSKLPASTDAKSCLKAHPTFPFDWTKWPTCVFRRTPSFLQKTLPPQGRNGCLLLVAGGHGRRCLRSKQAVSLKMLSDDYTCTPLFTMQMHSCERRDTLMQPDQLHGMLRVRRKQTMAGHDECETCLHPNQLTRPRHAGRCLSH